MPHATEHTEAYDSPLSALLKGLTKDISTLVRQEIGLARVEMTDKAKIYARASTMLVVAAVLALLAIGVLTACIVLVIDLALPAWAAALIVAIVYLVIAGVFGLMGMARFKKAGKPIPEETIETIKEDVSWAKQRAKSVTT